MWWAGMRGVASVALALAIPLKTDDGSPFPGRDEIVFIAFAVIMTTLVFQGLTLPWLVRKLGVRADTDAERVLERDLAIRAAKAAKRRLKEIEDVEELPEDVMEQLHAAGVRRGCADQPRHGRRGAPGRRTRSGWSGSGRCSASSAR